ncbi:glycolipid transfer protein domain-containing protein [Papiliotrema laurentii]|uniref:Glycolipid transfer protein domain-containing protein n=1 Tax=Papiliotrema laurentii TaxID=5418 RepID=A0AAD9L9F4_PAPLA|nr:glycolipid transfer protein domain-containing protein [Papiliotrema laurentii]
MERSNHHHVRAVLQNCQADVDIDNGVNAAEFCEACDAVIAFFDLFTNAPFAVVRSDLYSKITKVRARLDTREETLEGLLEDEKARGYKGPDAVTGAMTWLLRSLRFTSMGLRRNMTSEGEEVSTSMTWAYGETLKPYHGWAVRPIFLRHGTTSML